MARTQRWFDARFKAKVALEAMRERKSLSKIAQQFKVHPNQATIWKQQLLSEAGRTFALGDGKRVKSDEPAAAELYNQIGRSAGSIEEPPGSGSCGLSVPVEICFDRWTKSSVVERYHTPLGQRDLYLTAVIDGYSRLVLAWRLSNSLDVEFCLEALDEALSRGRPAILNSNQGAQLTSRQFTRRLQQSWIEISMNGHGRTLDNVFLEPL